MVPYWERWKSEEAKHHFAEHGYVVEQLVVDQEIIEPQADSLTQVAQAKIAQALEHMPVKKHAISRRCRVIC